MSPWYWWRVTCGIAKIFGKCQRSFITTTRKEEEIAFKEQTIFEPDGTIFRQYIKKVS